MSPRNGRRYTRNIGCGPRSYVALENRLVARRGRRPGNIGVNPPHFDVCGLQRGRGRVSN